MMKIDGKTVQLGLIGSPIEHTFSPALHNFIAEQTGDNCVYCAWRVEPQNLEDMIKGMRAMNIRGINATIPHKVHIIEYLDEISPQARLLGSVNTVVNREGRLVGYNTDTEGFYMSLCNSGIVVKGKDILILGAGGVVKPILVRLIQEKPKSVTVLNRTKDKTVYLKEKIMDQVGFEINTELCHNSFDLVINSTSAGMEPQLEALPTDAIDGVENLEFINKSTAVIDMIYNPAETRFLREARFKGAKTLNGLDMLINQGILAYELFMDKRLPDDMGEKIKKEVFKR